MKFYLVGIKGNGMCSLATILYDLGHEVNGCDVSDYFDTELYLFNKANIETLGDFKLCNECTYIIGNAFKNSSIFKEITNANLNYYFYGDFIEIFFKEPKISISGTHGKTTVTSFISQLIDDKINLLCGDGVGRGSVDAKYLVLEACEYRNTFLSYRNKILVINNIEYDHPDFYSSVNDVVKSFQKAADQSDIVIVNGDCINARKIKHHNLITFGLNSYNNIVGKYHYTDDSLIIEITLFGKTYTFETKLYGVHNVYNFMASAIACFFVDGDLDNVLDKAKTLSLPNRRMSVYNYENSIIIDDFAHHPTEIKNCILSVKERFRDYNVVVFFQPHTYSRLEMFLQEFICSLSYANEVYILDVFSSIREVGSGNLLLENSEFLKFDERKLDEIGKHKAVYLFIGAGDIVKYSKRFK